MNINEYPLWTALITPFQNDGSIDFDALKALVKEQERAKCGLLILGSTGEALNLDDEEKRKIIEYVCQLSPKVPLMVGVGGINLDKTARWVDYLEGLPIHALLLVTPLYSKPGPKGQYQWFKHLMDRASRPCMLYNIPGRTGTSLHLEAIKKLNGHPHFWAIKEASGSTADFSNYVEAAPNAKVYSGNDPMLPSYAPLGAKGLVSVASNAWPLETKQYVKQALNGTLKESHVWEDASRALFAASNPIPVKILLSNQKRINSPILRSPLTHEELEDYAVLETAHKNIENWMEKYSNAGE